MFEYELDGEVLQFTQEDVDKRAKEKGLTTEEYLAQHPEVKSVDVEKTKDVAEPGAAVASETTAPDASASSLENALSDFPILTDNPETVKKAQEAGLDVVAGARQEDDTIKGVTLPEIEIEPIEKQQEDLSKEIGEYNVKMQKAADVVGGFYAQNIEPFLDDNNKLPYDFDQSVLSEFATMREEYFKVEKLGLDYQAKQLELSERKEAFKVASLAEQKVLREVEISTLAQKSGIPKPLIPYMSGFYAGTTRLGVGLIEFVDNYGYKPLAALATGKTVQEIIDEGEYDIPTDALNYAAAKLETHKTKVYDDEGNPMDYLDLIKEGRYLEAAQVATEEAFSSSASLAIAVAFPLAGSAALGASSAGNSFEQDLKERPDATLSDIYIASTGDGLAEFGTELIGAKLFRYISSLKKAGVSEKIVNDFTTNYVLNVGAKTFGGFGGEFLTEGATSVIQNGIDKGVFDDEITTEKFIRDFFHDGGIGGLLGGPAATVVSATTTQSKEQIFNQVAPIEFKQVQFNIAKSIQAKKIELESAKESDKADIEQEIKELNDAQVANKKSLYKTFNTLNNKELKTYAQNSDIINENKSIFKNPNSSEEVKNKAAEEIQNAITKNNNIIQEATNRRREKLFENVSLQAEALKKEGVNVDIKKGNSKDFINWRRSETEQQEQESFDIGAIQAMDEIINDPNATPEEIAEARKEKKEQAELFKTRQEILKGESTRYGAIRQDGKGGLEIFINQESELRDGVMTTATHEFGHALLYATLEGSPDAQKAFGDALLDGIEDHGIILEGTEFQRRLDQYTEAEGKSEEVFTLAAESIQNGDIKYNESLFGKIKDIIGRFTRNRNNFEYKFDTNRDVFNFLRDYTESIESGNINTKLIKAAAKGIKGKILPKDIKPTSKTQFSKEINPKAKQYLELEIDNESLVDIINSRSSSAEEVFGGIDALIEKNWPVISNAIKFNPTGEISMDAVKEAVAEQMQGVFPEVELESGRKINRKGRLLDTYNKTRKVTTFLTATLGPRTAEILARGKQIDANTRAASLDKAVGIQDDSAQPFAEESSTYQEAKPKINILQDFAGVQEDKIVSISKPVEGDTFKQIIEKYAGRSGQEVFGIPAKKIMEGGANLIPTIKIKEGMAVPSEALQIQRFFGAAQNLENFVKTLPLYNVTEMTADINRQGENIEVSRDTYGVAIGLKGLPLDYFYEGFTDPTGVMTSPKGRSKGLTSQTPVKKLKQKFRKPTKEVLDKLRKDLGITPAKQRNEYTRDIGQLLKGLAKVYSINASLSGAQRNQEAKLEEAKERGAKPEEIKAIKQQTADITAAQSKTAFSKDYYNNVNIKADAVPLIIIQKDQKNIDKLYKSQRDLGAIYKDNKTVLEAGAESINNFLKSHPQHREFISNTMTGGVTGGFFLTKPEFNKVINQVSAKQSTESLEKGYRVKYNDKRRFIGEKLFEDKKFLADKKKRLPAIYNFFKDLESHLKKNTQDAWIFREMARDTGKHQNAFTRVLAPFTFYPAKNGKAIKNQPVVEEHSMPQNNVMKSMLNAAVDGNVDKQFKITKAAFMQGSFLETDDKTVNDSGMKESMPDVFYDKIAPRIESGELEVDIDGLLAVVRLAAAGTKYAPINIGKTVDLNNYVIGETKQTIAEYFGIDKIQDTELANITLIENLTDEKQNNYSKEVISKAISNARPVTQYSKKSKGMSTFDFDETLIIDGENFIVAEKDGVKRKVVSGDWPIVGPKLAEEGYSFDFTDFVNVRGGVDGPLLQKMKNQIKKYGTKNVFVLTARPQESATAIHEWLKTKDIDIPFENITGLGKSSGDAKAQWFVDKYAEGYNDMYFVDDALPNVEAVKHVFDQLDIKGKSVQAKIKFSKSLSTDFNKMLERTKGVGAEKIFSRIGAQKRGKNIGRFTFFVPPSADDFAGLLRYFVGKGEQGNRDLDFFNKALIKPFARADRDMKEARQSILNDHKALRKEMPQVVKKLGKMIDDSGFTFDNAIRVYLWDKAGFDIPGLSKRDIAFLKNVVRTDQDLKSYADTIGLISKQDEGYVEPSEYWDTESIAADLQNVVNKQGRKKFLAEWKENVDVIFSPENLNKIEATYGSNFREALENILWRMENGTNRAKGMGRIESAWNNWVNNSVGAIMFFNARSAVLQTLSTVNFINFEDNNIFAASKAFANQKQYWKDFSFLFNSDFLKQRRAGLQTNINEAEIANAVAGATNKAKAALQYLLKKGFLPTQIADSFAIASGGATYYRNRIKKYVKQGMSQAEAETQAMEDFTEIAEETQQSARPDRISQQQASSLGRIILAFANTPMQYARLIKKAAGDLRNKRGDWRSNVSRIIYYGAVQSIIFSGLQSAIFALAFDNEEPEQDEIDTKISRTLQGMLDSLLRGAGLAGAVVSTIKNTVRKFREEDEDKRPEFERVLIEMLQLSPPIGSKSRKIFSALKTYEYNRDIMGEMNTFDLENPLWTVTGNVVSATTNVPLDRGFRKIDNIKEALNQDNQTWQRVGLALGWDQWSLGVDPYKDIKEAEKELRKKKKEEKKKNQQRCTKIKSDGQRCKIMVNKPKTRCHYHD